MYVLPKKHTGNFIYQAKEGYFLTLSRTPDVHVVDTVGFLVKITATRAPPEVSCFDVTRVFFRYEPFEPLKKH